MKKLLIALVLLLTLSGCAAEPLPVPELTLALASDLHYLSPTLTDYGPDFINLLYSSDGKVTQYTPQLTDPAWALWQTLTDRVSFASYMSNTLSREEPRDQNAVYIPFD